MCVSFGLCNFYLYVSLLCDGWVMLWNIFLIVDDSGNILSNTGLFCHVFSCNHSWFFSLFPFSYPLSHSFHFAGSALWRIPFYRFPWHIRASLVAQTVKRLPDPDSIPGSGRSPGGGNGTPLQYSCLENPMDGGAWWATVHGLAECWTWLSDFTFFLSLWHIRSSLLHTCLLLLFPLLISVRPRGLLCYPIMCRKSCSLEALHWLFPVPPLPSDTYTSFSPQVFTQRLPSQWGWHWLPYLKLQPSSSSWALCPAVLLSYRGLAPFYCTIESIYYVRSHY